MSTSDNPFTQPGAGAPYQGGPAMPPQKSKALPIVLIILAVVAVMALIGCGIMAALLFPAVSAARGAAQRMVDMNNMKQVGLAMHNYYDVFRSLPAPAATNSEEVEVWSWRVSILPFLENSMIYDQLDFTNMQPWDSEQNLFLRETAPAPYLSARSEEPMERVTHVFLITEPANPDAPSRPIFVKGEYTDFTQVTDGLSNTIMAIQLVKHAVPWASPNDLSPKDAYKYLRNEEQGAHVLMGDGSVVFLPNTIDEETFYAMVSRDGGESVIVP